MNKYISAISVKTTLKLILFFGVLLTSILNESIAQHRLTPAEPSNFYEPLSHNILSSSIIENYRFRDPFRMARINSQGEIFAIDKQNKVISVTMDRAGSTNSRLKELHLIVTGVEVDYVEFQYGLQRKRHVVKNKEFISIPDNSIWNSLQKFKGGVLSEAWSLGTSDWRERTYVKIYYLGQVPESLGTSFLVTNPNSASRNLNQITHMMLSPVNMIMNLAGESSFYHQSFVNYEITIPQTDLRSDFFVTTNSYGFQDNFNHIVRNQFGSSYRVADWNDLKQYHQSGGNLSDLFHNLGISEKESVFVTRNGSNYFSQNRTYFASFHRHNRPSNYLAHENLNEYEISLGSWHGDNRILLIRR